MEDPFSYLFVLVFNSVCPWNFDVTEVCLGEILRIVVPCTQQMSNLYWIWYQNLQFYLGLYPCSWLKQGDIYLFPLPKTTSLVRNTFVLSVLMCFSACFSHFGNEYVGENSKYICHQITQRQGGVVSESDFWTFKPKVFTPDGFSYSNLAWNLFSAECTW